MLDLTLKSILNLTWKF